MFPRRKEAIGVALMARAARLTLATLVATLVSLAPGPMVATEGDVGGAAAAAEWVERPVGTTHAVTLPSLPATTVWLRSWLRVPDAMAGMSGTDLWRDSMTLTLEDLPGPVMVLLNGRPIVEAKDIPAGAPQRFKVPRGSFEKGLYNALVIQIDGTRAKWGLTVAPIIAGYFDEVRMERPWQMTGAEPAAPELAATAQPPVVAVYNERDFHPATSVMAPSPEPVRGLFVSPEEALRKLETDGDLIVEELLHEPDVAQPTHVSFDERGRLWVAQYRQCPYPAGVRMISRDKYYRSKYDRVPPPPPGQDPGADIISVFEDHDGDGRYETHHVVLAGLNMANAALVGHGGLWVMSTPYLLFYPARRGIDAPAGPGFDGPASQAPPSAALAEGPGDLEPPEVRLAGFGLEDTHSVANGLAWGLDGWLYGAQGSTTTSRVTRPGIDPPGSPGVYVEGCMVWRYHPERRLYEVFADGGGNTFGVSFDDEGRLFTGHNGGDTRGWHQVQEGVYLKQGKDPGKFGPPANPYAFGELPMMRSTHPVPRFSHMTILASGAALPARLRGQFLAVDPLHHCVIAAARARVGSTFETTDSGAPLRSEDLTFRPVYMTNAPDGSVVIADFREEFIAHGQNYQSQIDPSTGRIYRLRGKELPLERSVDLSRRTPSELVALLSHPSLWQRHTAVRLLGERRDPGAAPLLLGLLDRPEDPAPHPSLEALWALHQMGRLDEPLALRLLAHAAAPVRAWTIRLLGDERGLPPSFQDRLASAAATEPDPEVRCQILSTARRLPAPQALPLVKAIALASCETGDADDAFIPLLAWLVLESHCASRRDEVLGLLDDEALWPTPLARLHLLPRLMRRLAASGSRQELLACASLLRQAPTAADRAALLGGFEEAFVGRGVPSLPDELLEALAASGQLTLSLRVRRREPAALAEALARVHDDALDPALRLAAIRLFGEVEHPPAAAALLGIICRPGPDEVRAAACSALLIYDDPHAAGPIVDAWPTLEPGARSAALGLLSSRASWGRTLLDRVATGGIPRSAVTPDVLARLRLHRDEELTAMLERRFPASPPVPSAAHRPRIEAVRGVLAARPGDAYRGEPLFASRCGACHTLFHKGGRVGPDLTSYQRDDLGTMLVSVIDPNADIREGFENLVALTADGRALGGLVVDQDANIVVLRGSDGADIRLRREELDSLGPAGSSLMPEGLLDDLTDGELRDLFAYLRQSQPITR